MIWLLIGFALISYGMIFYAEYRKERKKKKEKQQNTVTAPTEEIKID